MARSITVFKLLLLTLQFAVTRGAYQVVGCDDVVKEAIVKLHINAAFKVAQNAVDRLEKDFDKDIVQAAYEPLFSDNDKKRVTDVLKGVVGLEKNSVRITFYCNEDHVTLTPEDSKTESWIDTAFTNNDDGQRVNPGPGIPQAAEKKVLVPRPKPGDQGSYSILGYKSAELNADFSGQAHIFLSPTRRNPDDRFDQRLYDVIKAQGIKPEFNFITNIKPLAQTVLHELTHIAGGLKDPAHGEKVIRDKGGYGWINCVNKKKNNNPPPVESCDSYVMLAQALYLQIKDKPTYWSTGAVDPETLRPVNLSPPPSKRNLLGQGNEAWVVEKEEEIKKRSFMTWIG